MVRQVLALALAALFLLAGLQPRRLSCLGGCNVNGLVCFGRDSASRGSLVLMHLRLMKVGSIGAGIHARGDNIIVNDVAFFQ